MKRNMILNVSVAVAVFCTAAIGAMSFKKGGDKAVKADTTYFYISSDMSAGAFATPDSAHWSITNSNGECGEPDPIRPCKITVPAGSTLSSVLSGKDNDAVLAISEGYKSAP